MMLKNLPFDLHELKCEFKKLNYERLDRNG